MDRIIGFGIDRKNTMTCITPAAWRDRYTKLTTEMGAIREWLKVQRPVAEPQSMPT